MRAQYPELKIAAADGYFEATGDENNLVLQKIRDFAPEILMVGMGMPRQEHWIHDNFGRVGKAIMLPCGAAIDYVAGEVPTPPRWAGRFCLEWLCRLVTEPRRLWRRYLLEPWFLLFLTAVYWCRVNLALRGAYSRRH